VACHIQNAATWTTLPVSISSSRRRHAFSGSFPVSEDPLAKQRLVRSSRYGDDSSLFMAGEDDDDQQEIGEIISDQFVFVSADFC
jgi:hypothetical protein